MNVLSLFDGISCGRLALERAGFTSIKYYASEISTAAITVSEHNYPDLIRLGDVQNWKDWDINWNSIDLLVGGTPCQGFSFAGKQLNFNDPRSKLFFVYLDILNHIKSLNPNVRFLLENVKMKREYQDIISKSLGVEPIMINSSLVSAQNRKRNYWANWGIKQPQDKGILLSDIVLDGIVEKDKAYCLTCRSGNARDYFKKHQSNIAFIPSSSGEYKIENGKINIVFKKSPDQNAYTFDVNIPDGRYNIRPLSPVECERLQTLPDHYTSSVGITERYNQLGNGWSVDTITHILKELKSQEQS